MLEPVLGCVTRGIDPPCPACAAGDLGNCERLAFGHLDPGLQTGFCCDTGGGWSTAMVAHPSQLARRARRHERRGRGDGRADRLRGPRRATRRCRPTVDTVVVIGAGTLGLLTDRRAAPPRPPAGAIVVDARYPHQMRLARELGADIVCEPDELPRLVRRLTGSLAYGDQLTGGCDAWSTASATIDSIAQALAIVGPRGRVVLVGMPGKVKLELTTLWHRETQLRRRATPTAPRRSPTPSRARTFDLAFELAGSADLGRLVSHTYPLAAYREAPSSTPPTPAGAAP